MHDVAWMLILKDKKKKVRVLKRKETDRSTEL